LCQRSYVANIMGRHNVGDLRIRTRDRASLPQSMLLKFPTHIFAAWVYICDLCDTYAHSNGSASELNPEHGARLRNWIKDTQQDLNGATGEGIEDSEPSGVLAMPLVMEEKLGHPMLYQLSRHLRTALKESGSNETLNDRFISSARPVELI
jgi:hypothetical protein